MLQELMASSRLLKCVPTFCGSLNFHVSIPLFRFIANSPEDFIYKCGTTVEIIPPYTQPLNN